VKLRRASERMERKRWWETREGAGEEKVREKRVGERRERDGKFGDSKFDLLSLTKVSSMNI
jgi:hypothetical protein